MQAFGNQGPMAARGESGRHLFSFIKSKEMIGEQEVGWKSRHSIWTLGTLSSLGFKNADVLRHQPLWATSWGHPVPITIS